MYKFDSENIGNNPSNYFRRQRLWPSDNKIGCLNFKPLFSIFQTGFQIANFNSVVLTCSQILGEELVRPRGRLCLEIERR